MIQKIRDMNKIMGKQMINSEKKTSQRGRYPSEVFTGTDNPVKEA